MEEFLSPLIGICPIPCSTISMRKDAPRVHSFPCLFCRRALWAAHAAGAESTRGADREALDDSRPVPAVAQLAPAGLQSAHQSRPRDRLRRGHGPACRPAIVSV